MPRKAPIPVRPEARIPQVAVAGCGYWGRNLVRVFHSIGALRRICEPDSTGKKVARSIAPSIPVVERFDQLLRDPQVEAVIIATPAESHARLASEALRAGKHVFIEKPLALSVKEGEELLALSRRLKRTVMVGHILSYHPAVMKLKELIDSGELGKIQYINSNRLNFGKVRQEENILWSFAPHDISTILMLLDEFPREVRSFGGEYIQKGVSDVTLTTLDFASGVKGHIFVSWMHPYKEQRLIVVGDKKMAVFDDTTKEKLFVYPHTIEWHHRTPHALKMDRLIVPVDATEPLLAECLHFLECLQNGHRPRTDAEEGLRVLRVLAASEQSLRQDGKPIPLQREAGTKPEPYFVHPSVVVDENVTIGEGTKIWHFSHILHNSRIGKRCVIGQNVMIGPEVRIGDNVKIQNNVSVYKGVTLESDVFCGPSMVFTNVINPRSAVSRKDEFRDTRVKRGATLGANSTILCGVTIGRYAFVGAGAVVTRNVPDYALVTGLPARIAGWMCECGVKLRFVRNKAKCERCGETYRRTSDKEVSQA